ncbi:MAG: ATP-binding protein, partial [Phycisphaerales bacterium]
FLANMSHEIRTPMTAILGYADLLSEQCGSGEDARRAEYVGTIKRNGEHLLSIINDILDISKIEAGKMTVELVRVDPMGLLREIEQLMSVKAQAKGIALGVEQECPLPAAVVTDAVRLRQVLVNLVGNAIKFTEVGGVRIRVGLCGDASGGQLLRVRVTDSGIGMTQSQVDGLFEAFHQADSSVTRRFGGTGLGLRISRSLAEMLGGTVTATSEPGVGSEFTLTVALRPDLNVPTAGDEHPPVFVSGSATGPAANLAGVRIFLAEDGPDNQRLISFHLRKAGAEVRVFENGRVALEAMTADGTAEGTLRDPPPCDLLLTDMQMPEMDGYTLASVLRERGSKLPIVALTAHAMGGDAEKCISAGCDAYATKPIDRERLVSICAAAAFSPRRA